MRSPGVVLCVETADNTPLDLVATPPLQPHVLKQNGPILTDPATLGKCVKFLTPELWAGRFFYVSVTQIGCYSSSI